MKSATRYSLNNNYALTGSSINPSKDPVAIVLKEKPDLILMNVVMPVMDGFRATEKIKSDKRTKDIPLVFLTNLGQKEDKDKGMRLGANKYILTSQSTPDMVINEVCQVLKLPAAFNKKSGLRHKPISKYPQKPYADLPADEEINRGNKGRQSRSFVQRLFGRMR